jgi:hypothetical protein
MIGLAELDREPKPLRSRTAQLFDVGKRRAAVKLRLAHTEQIEVRSIKNVDGIRHFCGTAPAMTGAAGLVPAMLRPL